MTDDDTAARVETIRGIWRALTGNLASDESRSACRRRLVNSTPWMLDTIDALSARVAELETVERAARSVVSPDRGRINDPETWAAFGEQWDALKAALAGKPDASRNSYSGMPPAAGYDGEDWGRGPKR